MDITNILNSKGSAVAVEQQFQQQLAQVAHMDGRNSSETGSERGMSPHASDHSSAYSSRSVKPLQPMPNMPNSMRYPSPSQLQQSLPMLTNEYAAQNLGLENGYMHSHAQSEQQHQSEQNRNSAPLSGGNAALKAFACTTCGKGFARRSDLARHERIHSGVRPHVCDFEGCGKQFIQRSALTVHARVHTGEKPHMCERCSKPFSDSSSLARHRRIHSGKRPYKCPFANCQKTFTRRTTLTRHQNHHTGTVDEAAAETAAVLASRPPGRSQRNQSDGGTFSDAASTPSTTSPLQSPMERMISLSPNGLPQVPSMRRESNEFSYLATGSLPPHMRIDLQQPTARSSPSSSSPSLSSFGGNQHRPSLTSHPSMYGPPPTLEPPTHHEGRLSGSANVSPHLNSTGWQSLTHPGMASPAHGDSYMYPEPPYGTAIPQLYYPNSNIRRPQSTEPDQYDTKPRLVGGEVWSGQI